MSGAGRGGADVADRPAGAGPESGRDHPRPLTVLGIPGSLRAGSFNRRLLEEARELAPDGMQVRIFGLEDLPLYDADLDTDGARPEPVQALKRAIGEADAVLIATPEYNHSIPGVLKNAIDWASRPAGRSPLREKPVAVMGASPGGIGTARAQQHLQSVLLSTLALPRHRSGRDGRSVGGFGPAPGSGGISPPPDLSPSRSASTEAYR